MSTIDPTVPRTVVGLSVENFKRISAVDITPEPGQPIITVSGANAQGKSSVLDALWAALESSAMSRATGTNRPVRDGETKATVRVDLGDIIVTRSWTKGGTSKLTVSAADTGAEYKTPQKLLDALLGRMSFDPLAFTRMSSRDQVTTLSSLVDLGIDLDQVAAERKSVYDERTAVGRARKDLGTVPTVDADAPTEEQSASDIIAELRDAQNANDERRRAVDYLEQSTNAAAHIERQITDLQARLAETHANISKAQQHLDTTQEVNTDDLETALANVEDTNRAIRDNNANRQVAAEAARLDAKYQQLTDTLARMDEDKSDALAAAEFPLAGLSFGDDGGITYHGVPLPQASTAEQLRVSCALAAAANPSIRVMRVTDGSLLDTASRQALADIATENEFQVWMELVDETGAVGVVIEDGKIKED